LKKKFEDSTPTCFDKNIPSSVSACAKIKTICWFYPWNM